MAWKIFLLGSAVLLVMKLLFRTRLREWGRRLDHAVNLTLILLVVWYAGYFVWQLIRGPG